MNIYKAMNLTQPMLAGTPLNIWFVWGVGTILVTIATLLVEFIRRAVQSYKQTKSNI